MRGLLAAALCVPTLLSCNASPGPVGEAGEFTDGATRQPTAGTLESMARILAAQGRDGECQLILERLIHDYPEHGPAYNDLAGLFLRQGELDQAVATIKLGLEQVPTDPVLLNNAGLCEVMLGDSEAARDRFMAAIEVNPASNRLRANLALSLGLLGREDEALALYSQVVGPGSAAHNLEVIRTARSATEASERESALGQLVKPHSEQE